MPEEVSERVGQTTEVGMIQRFYIVSIDIAREIWRDNEEKKDAHL